MSYIDALYGKTTLLILRNERDHGNECFDLDQAAAVLPTFGAA